jgi:outer membrane cobalamin receptor
LQNGFVTLGDVLRAAPGIRVSQPGNALEGETFMVRGVSGNQYMKILINDVPIKAAVAPGMSIGAQLPVRQAKRIEVVYGPSGPTYGEEACAGVINIILKETERPVYTQADLSFGRFNYNSLDLMFGGKLGRDRNIFQIQYLWQQYNPRQRRLLLRSGTVQYKQVPAFRPRLKSLRPE